jgi:hypothetical protein
MKFRGIEVLLDGKFIGDLTFGKTIETAIALGPHTLKVTNRLSSKSVDFEADDGEDIRFEAAGIALGGLWLVMTILGTVAYRVTLTRVAIP